jgi:predicted transglutaminase-like cysteine proteinase
LLGLALAVGLGCAGSLAGAVAYQYFAIPDPDDAWSHKIRLWQERELAPRGDAEHAAPAAVAGPGAGPARAKPAAAEEAEAKPAAGEAGSGAAELGALRAKYNAFLNERKRATARELAEWIQQQAREHYVPDGPIDHWATLEETFRSNGDDCDGLELLTYNLLRDLGFEADEVYRAIVFRRSDGQHHMVTLWFEDPGDPWVIDPTGAMTSGLPRMSSLPEWTPLKVFSEERDFTVRKHRFQTAKNSTHQP